MLLLLKCLKGNIHSQQKKNSNQCFIKILNKLKIIFIAYNIEVKKNVVFF
jgi:hypothetical protein